jgi:hypothetical protein
MTTLDSNEAKRINAALQGWRQGDVLFEKSLFLHIGHTPISFTSNASDILDDDFQVLTSEVDGLVIVTQTCDIVRDCKIRPYIQVAPLTQVSDEIYFEVVKCLRPSLAVLPSLKNKRLAVDLDRVMTIEKSIVASWNRTIGLENDADAITFTQALVRKLTRSAFPDEFTEFAKKLQKRFVNRHDKDSIEGIGLRTLREIRISALPAWDAENVEIVFWFIRNSDGAVLTEAVWKSIISDWLKLLPSSSRFQRIVGHVITLHDMSADDYIASQQLDLDRLTTATG